MSDQDLALIKADPYAYELVESLLGQLSELTRESYRQAIGEYLYFAWNRSGSHPYQNPHSCFAAYKGWLAEAYSSNTSNKKLSAVRKFYEYAAAAEIIPYTTFIAIKNIKNFRGDGDPFRSWLSEDQAKLFFNATDDTPKGRRDKVAILFMLVLGLRRHEIVHIRWSQIKEIDGKTVIVDIKGKGSKYRTVIIPDRYLYILEEYAQGYKQGYVLVKIERNGKKGESLSARAVNDIVSEYAHKLGLEDITPHSLRRTIGTIAHDKGVSLEEIQTVYGHESQRTTRMYLKNKLDMENQTTQVIDL